MARSKLYPEIDVKTQRAGLVRSIMGDPSRSEREKERELAGAWGNLNSFLARDSAALESSARKAETFVRAGTTFGPWIWTAIIWVLILFFLIGPAGIAVLSIFGTMPIWVWLIAFGIIILYIMNVDRRRS